MIFLICARGGSKGIKNKNIKKIYGKSLVERAINFAKKFHNDGFRIIQFSISCIQ